jgi:hypothetical protein
MNLSRVFYHTNLVGEFNFQAGEIYLPALAPDDSTAHRVQVLICVAGTWG